MAIPKFTFSMQRSSKRKVTSAAPPPLLPPTDTSYSHGGGRGGVSSAGASGKEDARKIDTPLGPRVELMEKKKASSDKYWSRFKK